MASHARGDQTRGRVLDAALQAFADGGLPALSVHEIRDRSGVSVGSLYHHFGSREGIVLALYERWLVALLDRIREAALAARSAQGLVQAMIDAYLDWVQANPDAARFVLSAAPAELDPHTSPALHAETLARVTPLVERAVAHAAAGEIVTLPPHYYELVVIGPVAETARRWLAGADIDLGQARSVLASTVWRALTPDVRAERWG
jgi:AcrR family transcriptional regulator